MKADGRDVFLRAVSFPAPPLLFASRPSAVMPTRVTGAGTDRDSVQVRQRFTQAGRKREVGLIIKNNSGET